MYVPIRGSLSVYEAAGGKARASASPMLGGGRVRKGRGGSVKPNIGHLEGSSGLAGLIKTILLRSLRGLHNCLTPEGLQIKGACPSSTWQDTPAVRGDGAARNADILTEKSNTEKRSSSLDIPFSREELLVFSAADEQAVSRMVRKYGQYVKAQIQDSDDGLRRLAYTLSARRSRFPWRSFAVVDPSCTFEADDMWASKSIRARSETSVVFVFTGQGAQYAGMGMQLMRYSVFEETLKCIDAVCRELGCEWSIFDGFLDSESIDRPSYSQVLCTSLQIALVHLMRSCGVVPTAVVGHSSGEIAAAYTVGALSLESACKVAYHRGRLAEKMRTEASSQSAMMSVGLSAKDVTYYLENTTGPKTEDVHVACINSPSNCTLSGPEVVIEGIKDTLDRDAIFAHKLNTGIAYHSPGMASIVPDYLQKIKKLHGIDVGKGKQITMISSVTAKTALVEDLSNPQYWANNLVSPVQFSDAIRFLLTNSDLDGDVEAPTELVEIGPHSALSRPISEILKEIRGPYQGQIRYHTVLKRSKSPDMAFLELLGNLFCRGHVVSLPSEMGLNGEHTSPSILTECPEYPFDNARSYWNESRLSRNLRLRPSPPSALLGTQSLDFNPLEPTWRNFLSLEYIPWLEDHIIGGSTIFPAAGMIMVALEAARKASDGTRELFGYHINDAYFLNPIRVDSTQSKATEIRVRARSVRNHTTADSVTSDMAIFSYHGEQWLECFNANVQVQYMEFGTETNKREELQYRSEQIQTAFRSEISSSNDWSHSQSSTLHAMSVSKNYSTKFGTEGSVYILNNDGTPLCILSDLHLTPVSLPETTQQEEEISLHGIEWKPQLSTLGLPALRQVCQAESIPSHNHDVLRFYPTAEEAMFKVLEKAREAFLDKSKTIKHKDGHRYLTALQHHIQQRFGPQGMDKPSDIPLETLLRICEEQGPAAYMFSMVARYVEPIQLGEQDALEKFFGEGGLEEFYTTIFDLTCDKRLSMLLNLASHENPGLDILEVGARTRGMTHYILDAFRDLEKKSGTPKFSRYTFSDISPAFFDNAKARFSQFLSRMVFRKFDLERDAFKEGFKPGEFDIVIAGSVLHATSDLVTTLRNVRQTMKAGGRIIFLEMVTPDSISINAAGGLLPGWWSAKEEYRAHSPLVTESRWDQLLRETGFSGNDLIFRDHGDDACHVASVLVSTAVEQSPMPRAESNLVIVADDSSDDQRALARAIQNQRATRVCKLEDVGDIALNTTDVVVCLLEVRNPILGDISEKDFGALKSLLKVAQRLLWVTLASLKEDAYPYSHIVDGLLRVARSEDINRQVISLAIEASDASDFPTMPDLAPHVSEVLRNCFDSESDEVEFVVRHGRLTTGRMVSEVSLNQDWRSIMSPRLCHEPWSAGPPLLLEAETPGILDTLQFVPDEAYQDMPDPGADEVEIEAVAWPLSFRDVLIGLGKIHGTMGYECAGHVRKVGSACPSSIRSGDRVFLTIVGSLRSRPRAKFENVFKIPDHLSFAQTISAINPGVTAFHSLVNLARLQKGEKVLIHSAAGGTGQMAVWVAKTIGAEIFVTVGNNEKKMMVSEQLGIPTTNIFHSRNTSFARGIKRVTNGYGVDVVLNSLSGDGLRASWNCMAPYGRFVEIGKADIIDNAPLPMGNFRNNVSFFAFDLDHLSRTNLTTDAVFENMTHSQWTTALRSKVNSSWNLHHLLPRSMDFFILLSSLASVFGTVSQSNYAAGCAFQDALAKHRTSQGEKGISINVGWMRTIGIVAEKEQYQNQQARPYAEYSFPIEEELLALLSLYCDPSYSVDSVDKSQVMIGARTPAEFLRRGARPPLIFHRRLFASFANTGGGPLNRHGTTIEDSPGTMFAQADGFQKRANVVMEALRSKLAQALGISASEVEPGNMPSDYGVDSLMAVELKNWIQKEFRTQLAVLDIMSGNTIMKISHMIASQRGLEMAREL
ncbi:hypothetical protein DL765_001412 [Monosporascus sp. GIB2]|nr:hypothetical protein DL765_001412 [Monosporascus sp. GIB2]